jgi:hypothetical protein
LAAALAFSLALAATGCTGGSESNAAVATEPGREAPASMNTLLDARKELRSIGQAIPVYQGAQFRDDLTQRDEVMIHSRYGAAARVYTLATDDSFPQVYHYYTTYLSQFRAFPADDTWPADQKNWRTLEVQLNTAMQDPFIPGEALDPAGQQVLLQVAETEAEPRTVIRYIVTPAPPEGALPPSASAIQSAAAPQRTVPVAR